MLKRLAVIAIILASCVALSRFVNLESLAASLLSLSPNTLASLLVLLCCSELIKGIRWAYFLRAAELDISTVDGVTCYLGAQAATAVPGGSLLALRLAEEHGQVRMYQAASGVIGQNIADMLGLSLVGVVGILATREHLAQFMLPMLVSGMALAGILIFRSDSLARWFTRQLNRWRLTRRFAPEEDDFLHHVALLMRWRVLLIGIAFSVLTTLIAIGMLMTLVNGLTDRGISTPEAIYVHSFAGLTAKAVPAGGGFGVTDASLAGLLNFIGIGLVRATFIALVAHTTGLVFRSVLGTIILLTRYPSVLLGQIRLPGRQPARARARVRPITPSLPVMPVVDPLASAVSIQAATPSTDPASD